MVDWAEQAITLKPAIPASQYLERDLGARLNAGEVTGIASAMYRLKHGSSISLSLPTFNPDTLKSVLFYLHRCRIDALHGVVRGGWFNSHTMCLSQDLLIWSRGAMQTRKLRDTPGLDFHYIGLNRETRGLKHSLEQDGRIARTVLCQSGDDISVFCQELKAFVTPFTIVVDMTPFGYREDPAHIAGLMEEHFPGVPLLFLCTIGDVRTAEALRAMPKRFPLWRQHMLDKTPIIGAKSAKLAWHPILVTVPDKRLNDRLLNAASLCRDLKDVTPHAMRKDSVSVVYRVLNALQTLAMPIEFYEQHLQAKRHGGIFPVKPLTDWLCLARRAKMSSGESQNLLSQAVAALEGVMSFISQGQTGKAQALSRWMMQTIKSKKRGLIVVGNEREANIMRSWLVTENARFFDEGLISVLGVNSVRESYKLDQRLDRVIVTGKLWDQDLWVLFAGIEVAWICYPSEEVWLCRLAKKAMFAGQACPEGKSEWWEFSSGYTASSITANTAMPAETWGDCSGQYLIEKAFEIDLPDDPDWMAALFADLKEPAEKLAPDSPVSPGEVAVKTENDFYRFDCNANIQVFVEKGGDAKVENVAACDLEEGMRLILLNGEDHGQFSVMEMLIDFVTGNSQESQMYQTFAARWFAYVDGAVWRLGSVAEVKKRLKDSGLDIGIITVQRWANHIGIGPQNRAKVVPAVAKLSGIEYSEKDLELVQKSQSKIMGLHTMVGKALKAAMIAEIEGATDVNVYGSKSVPLDVLRAMYTIEEVQCVRVYEDEIVAEEDHSLLNAIRVEVAAGDDRIVLTTRAEKSLDDSPYHDVNRVRECFRILAEGYHEVYARGGSLQAAIDMGLPLGIDFKSDSSSKTKGQYKHLYYPLYKGKKTDIGRHLGIGDSRNPKRCFRIHFHFDQDDQKIVVHHAGRHLTVASG